MKKTNFLLILVLAGTIVFIPAVFTKRTPAPAKEAIALSDTTVEIPPAPSNFPALLVHLSELDTTAIPLRMSGLQLDVKVIGNIAITTMDMTFYNDLNRILEGQLCFPLGEGQTVSGFGLETDGVMRDGVVVEKAKGRQVFESVVRRNIDPGLMEWTKGNNFKTRVYPIPAKGTKRVRITYEQELISARNSFIYQQPMLFKEKIDQFSLRAEVIQQRVKPVPSKESLVSMEFDTWNNSWVAQKTLTNFLANKTLAFEIPKTDDLQRVYTERTGDDENYFYFSFDPEVYAEAKKLPSSVCLFWDVSGSAVNRDIQKEEEILDAYFKKLQQATVKLVTFSNAIHQETEYTISNGNWNALKDALNKQSFDGGTQLGAIDLKNYQADEILLCSDGMSNFGEADMKLAGIPVVTVCSSPSADHAMLKYIAQSSGGHFINALSATKEEAIQELLTEPYRFLNATVSAGTITQNYPSVPSDFHRTFAMAGKLEGESAELLLNFGFGNKIVYSKKVQIVRNTGEVKDGMVKKLWAQKKIGELDLRYEKNKEEITALGKECSIVTRNTSLLVLDRLEDYIQHHVVPPQKDWQEKYYAAIKQEKRSIAEEKKAHLEEVLAAFKERTDWWKEDFSTTFSKKQKSLNSSLNYMADSLVTITATGSSASYNWTANETNAPVNNGNSSNLTQGMVSNAATYDQAVSAETEAGTYKVTVSDANACTIHTLKNKEIERIAKIDLKSWDPQTPYMQELKKAKADQLPGTYTELRKKYKDQPAFFLDAGSYLLQKGEKANGLRVLSNLAEFDTEDHQVMRVLAHKLQQAGFIDLAVVSFKEVLKIREEEPQSYRDLGLALAEKKDYQAAADMLCKVVNRKWDDRFPEVELLALNELNTLIGTCGQNLQLDSLDKRLIKPMPVDVRIVVNWDSDNCDMDLWVTDPSGETCMYSNNRTAHGGRISNDFTGGYGPEEFIVKKAMEGKYKVQVNYYGTRQQTLLGPTTVQAELYTNYGKPNQRKKEITLRLKEHSEVVDIGDLVFTR